jgi:hypothetical protein
LKFTRRANINKIDLFLRTMEKRIKSSSLIYGITTFSMMIFIISIPLFSSYTLQPGLATQEQEQEINELLVSSSSLTPRPSDESGTIQCITYPCEFPSSPQPSLPDSQPDNNKSIPVPKNLTQLPEIPPNDPEPCISPCPPGEICIQMCKPIGELETSVTESDSSSPQEQPQEGSSAANSNEPSDNGAVTTEESQQSTTTANDENN